MKKMVVSAIVGATLGVAVVASGVNAQASEADGVWQARTVDQIKADITKSKDNKYTIVWGDTLSGIGEASNLTVQKLADMNKIANVDLIYAGNTLVFEGNIVSVKNDKGETVAQAVIRPQDKNDANKPVGKQSSVQQAEEKTQGTPGTTAGTNSSQNETVGTENGTTTPSIQPEAPATTGSSAQKPADNKPTQSSQPAEKPSTPSTSGEQGGTTTPVIDPSTVTDQESDPTMIGNSGKVFNSRDEANNYGYAEIDKEDSEYSGFWVMPLVNKNAEPINKFTVDFYKDGPLN